MKRLSKHAFSARRLDILSTNAGSLWRKESRIELNLFKLKSYALVASSQAISQRATTIGVFATHAPSHILLVCMRRETKENKDHHKPDKVEVKKGQAQVKKRIKKSLKQHNAKKQPQLLLQIE